MSNRFMLSHLISLSHRERERESVLGVCFRLVLYCTGCSAMLTDKITDTLDKIDFLHTRTRARIYTYIHKLRTCYVHGYTGHTACTFLHVL